MPIPAEYTTSNPAVREALNAIPAGRGNKVGDFVAPDFPLDFETVDAVSQADHSLNLDDLRAPDAQAKEIRFEQGAVTAISVVERALKTRMDTRKIADSGARGVNLVAERAALLRDDILDAKEYRIAQLVLTAANYAAGHKDVTGLNFRTGDLINLVDGWKATILADGRFEANKVIIGSLAWRHARRNADFRTFAAGTDQNAGSRDLTLAAFAEFLGVAEVRVGDFSRLLGNGTAATQFWTTDSFLLFSQQNTMSDRTLAATAVVPYGPEFNSTNPLVDVRTENLPGTERLTEVGAYHRYRTYGRNYNLGFLVTGIVGV